MLSAADIAQSLGEDRSKKNVDRLVLRMAKEGFSFADLFETIEHTPLPVKWYLTWTLTHYVEAYPHLSPEDQALIWKGLQSTDHKGMLRDYWRTLTFINVDEEIAGAVYDKALLTASSPVQAIANRVHAMQVAYNIAQGYAELLEELLATLSKLPEDAEAGFMSRRGKIIKSIKETLRRKTLE